MDNILTLEEAAAREIVNIPDPCDKCLVKAGCHILQDTIASYKECDKLEDYLYETGEIFEFEVTREEAMNDPYFNEED